MIFERIQESLFFWQRNFSAIALVVVPLALLTTGIELLTGPALMQPAPEAAPVLNPAGALWAILSPIFTQAVLIPQLAAIQAGSPRGLQDCLLIGITTLPVLLAVNLITSAAMFIGLLFLILPGIWIFVRLSLAPFIAVLESLSTREALKKSFLRTDIVQWPMLGAWLLLLLCILTVFNILGGLLFQLAGDNPGSRLLLGVLLGLGASLLHVLLFRFYGLTRQDPHNTPDNNLH